MPSHRRPRSPLRPALTAAVVGLALLALGSTGTLSDWTRATVTNSSDSAAAGSVAFTHAYASSTCSGGPMQSAPAANCLGSPASVAAATTTPSTITDAITNNSVVPPGASMYQQVRVQSCAPVSYANSLNAANPMLPRYGVSFRTSGPWAGATNATTLDGSTGAGGDIVAEPGVPAQLLSAGGTVGWGVWFQTTTSAGGPIFALDSAAGVGSGNADKILYMNKVGKVGFVFSTNAATTGLSSKSFNDGVWHFAYARISMTSAGGVPVSSTTTLYVDGARVASSTTLIGASLASGYWHVGWAPISGTSYGNGLPNYWQGSVSNMVIFAGGSAPAVPTTNPASQSAFNTFAASASQQWVFGDSGTSTYTGSIGYVTGGDPCTMDTLGWTLGSTTAAAAGTTLRALVTAGWVPSGGAPAPSTGSSQTATTSYARVSSGYDTDVAGLRLYAPMSYRVDFSVAQTTGWLLAFNWGADPAAVFVA